LLNKNNEVNERLLSTIEELSQNIEKISSKDSLTGSIQNLTNTGIENL